MMKMKKILLPVFALGMMLSSVTASYALEEIVLVDKTEKEKLQEKLDDEKNVLKNRINAYQMIENNLEIEKTTLINEEKMLTSKESSEETKKNAKNRIVTAKKNIDTTFPEQLKQANKKIEEKKEEIKKIKESLKKFENIKEENIKHEEINGNNTNTNFEEKIEIPVSHELTQNQPPLKEISIKEQPKQRKNGWKFCVFFTNPKDEEKIRQTTVNYVVPTDKKDEFGNAIKNGNLTIDQFKEMFSQYQVVSEYSKKFKEMKQLQKNAEKGVLVGAGIATVLAIAAALVLECDFGHSCAKALENVNENSPWFKRMLSTLGAAHVAALWKYIEEKLAVRHSNKKVLNVSVKAIIFVTALIASGLIGGKIASSHSNDKIKRKKQNKLETV